MRKLKPIIMDGEEYEVIDNLGFHHSVGKYAKEIKVGDRLRIVTSSSTRGPWSFHKPIIIKGGPVIGQ